MRAQTRLATRYGFRLRLSLTRQLLRTLRIRSAWIVRQGFGQNSKILEFSKLIESADESDREKNL